MIENFLKDNGSFASILIEQRKLHNHRQIDLAEKLDLGERQIKRYEDGELPKMAILYKLCMLYRYDFFCHLSESFQNDLKGNDQPNSNSLIQTHNQPEDLQRIALDLDKLAQSVKRIYEGLNAKPLSELDIESRNRVDHTAAKRRKPGTGKKG